MVLGITVLLNSITLIVVIVMLKRVIRKENYWHRENRNQWNAMFDIADEEQRMKISKRMMSK